MQCLSHTHTMEMETIFKRVCCDHGVSVLSPQVPKRQTTTLLTGPEDIAHYEEASDCVEELALYLKPLSNSRGQSDTTSSCSPSQPWLINYGKSFYSPCINFSTYHI